MWSPGHRLRKAAYRMVHMARNIDPASVVPCESPKRRCTWWSVALVVATWLVTGFGAVCTRQSMFPKNEGETPYAVRWKYRAPRSTCNFKSIIERGTPSRQIAIMPYPGCTISKQLFALSVVIVAFSFRVCIMSNVQVFNITALIA